MRKFWAVVQENEASPLIVIQVEGKSRSKVERDLWDSFIVKLLMTERVVKRIQGMSIYEFAKKYGEKDFTFAVYDTIGRIQTGEFKSVHGRSHYK